MRLERVVPILVLVLVAAGIVLAFRVIGSPGHAREVSLDDVRQQDLAAMAEGVHKEYTSKPLPVSLPGALLRRDPVTNEFYDYERLDARRYVLCATFGAPSESLIVRFNEAHKGSIFRHGTGRTCYSFDAGEDWPNPQLIH